MRPSSWLTVVLPLLTACGGLGLDSNVNDVREGSGETTGESSGLEDSAPVEATLTGRTYAAALDEIVVNEPSGLASLLGSIAADALLFHVVREDAGEMELALTLSDDAGQQSACEPVVALPTADFSDNPLFFIEEGTYSLPIGGQDVELRKLTMAGEIAADAGSWADGLLSAEIDTRDLVGGTLPEGTDACDLVENLGGSCHACSDGVNACASIELELAPVEVNISFDYAITGEGC